MGKDTTGAGANGGARPAAAALLALILGCGDAELRRDDPFWQRAEAAPFLRLAPEIAAGAPGQARTRRVVGQVVGHGRSPGSGQSRMLEIQGSDGRQVTLHYRLSGDDRLDVETGQAVRLELFERRHRRGPGATAGLLLYRRTGVPPPPPVAAVAPIGAAPAAPGRPPRTRPTPQLSVPEELVAVVQVAGAVPRERLPPVLRSIEPSDVPAYHESGSHEGECEELRTHFDFVMDRPDWVVRIEGHALSPRLVAPGTQLVLDDGAERFAVRLLDNRKTVRGTCHGGPKATWSFSALRQPRPAGGAVAARGGQPAPPRRAAARPTSPDQPTGTPP